MNTEPKHKWYRQRGHAYVVVRVCDNCGLYSIKNGTDIKYYEKKSGAEATQIMPPCIIPTPVGQKREG